MDFTAEAMQKTLDIAIPTTFEIEDIHGCKTKYANKPLHQIVAAAPAVPELVNVSTLAGFKDLIVAVLEDEDFEQDCIIHIQDARTVMLSRRISDEYGRRVDLIKAQPVDFRQFQFGQWMNQEEFAIAVASLFAETADKQYVLNLASTLTDEATMTSDDDGFSQRAMVKKGLRLKEATTLKPRVALAPYRTFPEIDQPVSEFVFRAKCDGESKPMLMLVEADGGRWKIDAIATISKAMEAFELNIPIIA